MITNATPSLVTRLSFMDTVESSTSVQHHGDGIRYVREFPREGLNWAPVRKVSRGRVSRTRQKVNNAVTDSTAVAQMTWIARVCT